MESFKFPIEIIDIVLSHASRETLRTARSVCKAFDEMAQRHLLQTIFLKVNQDSFTSLDNISRDSSLRTYVREVVYDPALLPWDLTEFDSYKDEGVGSGFNLVGIVRQEERQDRQLDERRARTSFASNFSESQLQHHWSRYLTYLEGQKDLHRGTNERERLADIFSRLPYLDTITIPRCKEVSQKREINPFAGFDPTQDLQYASKVAQETLIEPEEGRFRMKRIFNMMQAAHVANRQIKTLEVDDLKIDNMSTILQQPNREYLHECLAGLTHLHLSLTSDADDTSMAHQLHIMLSHARNLESLKLVNRYEHGAATVAFSDQFAKFPLPKLRHLEMGYWYIEQQEFIEFLKAHASSLKSLSLECFEVHEGQSFIPILIAMADNLMLHHLDLKGYFLDHFGEAWIFSHDSCDVTRPSEKTLLQKVQDHVTGKGPCPFKRRENSQASEPQDASRDYPNLVYFEERQVWQFPEDDHDPNHVDPRVKDVWNFEDDATMSLVNPANINKRPYLGPFD